MNKRMYMRTSTLIRTTSISSWSMFMVIDEKFEIHLQLSIALRLYEERSEVGGTKSVIERVAF